MENGVRSALRKTSHHQNGVWWTSYEEFLKIDFLRLPLTRSLELFRMLARLGGELTALHLLESPNLAQPISEFLGDRNPEIEKVSWSRNTVMTEWAIVVSRALKRRVGLVMQYPREGAATVHSFRVL